MRRFFVYIYYYITRNKVIIELTHDRLLYLDALIVNENEDFFSSKNYFNSYTSKKMLINKILQPKEDIIEEIKRFETESFLILLSNEKYTKESLVDKLNEKKELPNIILLNEVDSLKFNEIIENTTYFRIQMKSDILIIAELIFYIFLSAFVASLLSVTYIFVTILSEKDPILLPGAIERCLKSRYYKLVNKYLNKCTICLDEFEDQDLCRVLSCSHYFHSDCVDPWLEGKSSRCPLCSQHLKS